MRQNLAQKNQCFQPIEVNCVEQGSSVAPNLILLIRAAKLVLDENYEIPCVIRDASSHGIKVRLFNALPDTLGSICVELSDGVQHPVEIIWHECDYAGLRFIDPVDVARLLADDERAPLKREVRLRTQISATVHARGTEVPVALQDISQQGASIECEKWLLVEELVRVEASGLPATYAKVRWRSHPHYGLLFERTFRLDQLAQIIAPHRH